MSVFEPIPLGRPIPPTPHAVSCSLPTMRAVRGYEEKDPAITAQMGSGYPRFVVHPFARQLAAHLAAAHGLAGCKLWLTSSPRMARELAGHLSGNARLIEGHAEAEGLEMRKIGVTVFLKDGIAGVAHPDSPDLGNRAKLFLQHVGGFISSREAEDHLVRLGLKPSAEQEKSFGGDAEAEIRRHLLPALAGAGERDLFLAPSGMNAVYAAFRATAELQAARGRTVWVQLGWLYLDTISILKKFTASPSDYVVLPDVFDRGAWERLFAERGDRIAGVLTEIPTNPLIETPDVAALAALCRKHGARLILDPSIASALSVAILPFADLLVASLTKYTASEGDVIAGLVAVNPAGPDAAELRRLLASRIEPVYTRDLARLAAEISQTDAVLARISAATPLVAEFLAGHPSVKEVFWALEPASASNYRKIARAPGSTGGVISFSLRGSLEAFYDRLRLAKGPSFGMKTTLICPFMYLAHYDLVSTPAGRAELEANGIDPDLLRLCVGTEPVGEIIAALAEALDQPA